MTSGVFTLFNQLFLSFDERSYIICLSVTRYTIKFALISFI